jgi:hypothetical protein
VVEVTCAQFDWLISRSSHDSESLRYKPLQVRCYSLGTSGELHYSTDLCPVTPPPAPIYPRRSSYLKKKKKKKRHLFKKLTLFFLFFGGTGGLQSRHSTALATPPVHFALVIFGDGSHELYA